jgi:hypothetical protein
MSDMSRVFDFSKPDDREAAVSEKWAKAEERLTAMAAAKNKAVEALKSWVQCEYPDDGKPCGYCIVCKLIAELEEVK